MPHANKNRKCFNEYNFFKEFYIPPHSLVNSLQVPLSDFIYKVSQVLSKNIFYYEFFYFFKSLFLLILDA